MSSLPSPAAAPLDDDDLFSEILLRLPPQPSSLPRASSVCKLWRNLASDPGFCRRFRAHHRRNPPLLGCFVMDSLHVHFQPALDPPNRISQGQFSFPTAARKRFLLLGCRHGLVLILDGPTGKQQKLLVWDPITDDQHHLGIPPGFNMVSSWIRAAVLRAPGDIHHFQVVLVGNSAIQDTHAVASVYSSATGVWDDLISTPLLFKGSSRFPSRISLSMPAVMVEGFFYWLLSGDSQGILEFDLDRQSLSWIPMPVENTIGMGNGNWVMQAEGGGLGLLFLRGFCAQLWKRKTDCMGVASWVLGRSIDLDMVLSLNSKIERKCPLVVGFAEDNNVLLLWTYIGVFMIQFEPLQFKKLFESKPWYRYYPFEGVYTADSGIGSGHDGANLLSNT